ncbi:MAG: MGH1-like glycoside hydrolase domain-containing protein, partial [Nocardioidaceae bacterium]
MFDDDRYVMVTSDWAKAGPRDLCLRIGVHNRGPEPVLMHVLPTVWFRNTWSWDEKTAAPEAPGRPRLYADGGLLRGEHPALGRFAVACSAPGGAAAAQLLFCENETNVRRLYGSDSFAQAPGTAYPKDGINDHVVSGAATVNPGREGTKAAFAYRLSIEPGATAEVRLRLTYDERPGDLGAGFDAVQTLREREADAFWAEKLAGLDAERAHVCRQAYAGLLASKQYYPYDVRRWLDGDPTQPAPPPQRRTGRNAGWRHLVADDLILMPDPWEYPWFAAWDLAFHAVTLAHVDPELAKQQLLLLLGDWFQHPDGQLPAYEWNLSDVNPPVHAWAALQIVRIDGSRDRGFLARALHKLLVNFTWWVNRKDALGNNLFEGGFLGLDNIGPFDRSKPLPDGSVLEQSDGTGWMALFCLGMLDIATELAVEDDSYDVLATKFLQHFCQIATAANDLGLWDEDDGFYYDLLRHPSGTTEPVRVCSAVGLLPVIAVSVLGADARAAVPVLEERLRWIAEQRPEYADLIAFDRDGSGLLALCDADRLGRVLARVLDEDQLLSPYGVRSLSARHGSEPVSIELAGARFTVGYEPGEGETPLFGGNSNWRGPV